MIPPDAPLQRPPSVARFVAQIAVLTALAVLIRRFLTLPIYGFNLGGFPLVMSGLILGPVGGAYVGALSDIIGLALMPNGAFNFVYTFTAMLTACVPVGLLRMWRRAGVPSVAELMIAIAVGQLLTKVIIQPFYFELLSNIPWTIGAARALPEQAIHVPLYAILAYAILRALPPRLTAFAPTPPRANVAMPSPGLALPLQRPYS